MQYIKDSFFFFLQFDACKATSPDSLVNCAVPLLMNSAKFIAIFHYNTNSILMAGFHNSVHRAVHESIYNSVICIQYRVHIIQAVCHTNETKHLFFSFSLALSFSA